MFTQKTSVYTGILLLFHVTVLIAEEAEPQALVGHGPGVLAVRIAEQGEWSLVDEGDTLPSQCSMRTSSAGPCRIELPTGGLVVDSETRLDLQVAENSLVLEAGRILVQTDQDHPWSVQVDERLAVVEADTTAEVSRRRNAAGEIRVVRGAVSAGVGDAEPLSIPAGRVAQFEPDARIAPQPAELSDADRKAIGRWSDLGRPSQGLGQLLIEDAQSASPKRLNIARYHVNVVLQPPVALVQIDQSFYNPYNQQEEGTFVFNLPPGASVSRFAMYVTPDQLIEGELIERKRAAEVYQSIVNRKRDPAILEQIGDNLFRMRVFPIFARDTKRILLDYTIPLKSQHGQFSFQLPLLSDLEPIWDFRLSGAVRGPTLDGSLVSQSHPELLFDLREDESYGFALQKRMFQPERDFCLRFKQREDGKVRLRSQLAPPLPLSDQASSREWRDPWSDRSATYFLASIPPEQGMDRERPAPADVLILADTSSGMRGVGLVRESVRTIVQNLGAEDRFRLMAVDVAARPIHDGWIEAASADSDTALAKFDQQFCLGATDLATGLTEAVKSFPDKAQKRRRIVVYIGDGEDTTLSSMSPNTTAEELASKIDHAGAIFVGVVARR